MEVSQTMISNFAFDFNYYLMGGSSISSKVCLLAIIALGALCCQDANCVTCNTYIADSSGKLVETCSECVSGYNLAGDSKCYQDNGLIIGISIGAVGAVVAQIACYIYCKIKYDKINRKNVDMTLEEIYNEEMGDPAKQGGNEAEINTIQTEYNVYVTHKCGVCEQKKTSVKTECGHYFHFACFKTAIMLPESGGCPKCGKKGMSPIKLICCKCLNKQRSLPLETFNNLKHLNEYTCFICKMKQQREEETKKWWKN